MNINWTFGRKIAAGFFVSTALLIAIGTVSYLSINQLITTGFWVSHTHKVLEEVANFAGSLQEAETGFRGYAITGNPEFLEPYETARTEFPKILHDVKELTSDNPAQQKLFDQIEMLAREKFANQKENISFIKDGHPEQAIKNISSGNGKRIMDEIRKLTDQAASNETNLLKKRTEESDATVSNAKSTILYGTLICLIFVIAAGYLITRALGNQIGAAVGHVQSSSAELQAAASQQASGAKEQATAMSEISTTISELVATSRQIAESAQRVASIAEQNASAARNGDVKVGNGQESMSAIRRQVDMVVNHMLDLGRKSQEIGAVLDIVSELAEQTNILAINATIEAVGAGEAGKRFAVVADEIRKLADRVSNSTKEIRGQIEDVRSAVNTTVMATESSAKAVDAGAKQFAEIALAFRQIGNLVGTTTEAAREIELSTKQQATAAEQVRLAVTDISQATRESEASSSQTLQTASQLASLSSDLRRMIQAPVG
ncbi:CHASE3 domain-containing protein [Undibacterium terreum]|uniref:Methyl-accepting transducer domain-containing protein n=1 Tax=Undibacterium terreum TaxID=1224302 RepID=A0A916XKU3_9BURK|nr:CHASE3 domain-containing protein [Undibacterium terreum]GGC79417.1 hypothetical protein GCM10011396_28310 [Undibacterium terreum]